MSWHCCKTCVIQSIYVIFALLFGIITIIMTELTEKLKAFGSVPMMGSDLSGVLSDYDSPKDKLAYMVKQGQVLRLKRDLFCVSSKITGERYSLPLIANHLYGPSYVSLETALAYYQLIPERVVCTQSVVTKRAKQLETPLGLFTYQTVPEDYYPIGIRQEMVGDHFAFLIASPEKALCDLLLMRSRLRLTSARAMQDFLLNEMRMDFSELKEPDLRIVDACIATHHKSLELQSLRKVLEHECV